MGGAGTRISGLVKYTPKPLLAVGGESFIRGLIKYVARFGIDRVLLLAGYRAEVVEECFRSGSQKTPGGLVEVRVVREREPLGTGGALANAVDYLDDEFLLLNGDSFFNIDLSRMIYSERDHEILLALRNLEDTERFGVVEIDSDNRVTSFSERGKSESGGLVNGGIYRLRRAVIEGIPHGQRCSLERDILPRLAAEGRVYGRKFKGRLVDIGIPTAFEAAQRNNPFRAPAAFLDRDGVLNHDTGHVGSWDRWEWIDGAVEAVRRFNELGFFVFVVTNQAGVGKGFYSEEAVRILHRQANKYLAASDARIDDFRYCPHHPRAARPEYRKACRCRKPQAGMIQSLLASWPVDLERSFLIGDKAADMQAAENIGLRGYLFNDTNLFRFATNHLEGRLFHAAERINED